MKRKKLKGILGLVIAASMLFSNVPVFASTQDGNDSENSATSNDNSLSNDNEGVLKVNMDDSGAVTYSVNGKENSSESLEDKQFSWDNASVYFAMTDRFKNGDKSNDHSYGRSEDEQDAANYENRRGTFHGGDLKGLTDEVNDGYFDNLGVNAIWISAPYEQIHGAMCSDGFKHYAYHGYFTLDYTKVDDNMGKAQDLHNFIDTAHKHGIRVVFDVVMNHCGYADPVTATEYNFGKLNPNWENIYRRWDERQYNWYNDYTGIAAQHDGAPGIMDPSGDWVSNWWGPDWIRNIPERFSGYQGYEGDGLTGCSGGLPDFKTESQNQVSVPAILRNKWIKEERYDQEIKELDNFFNRTGNPRTVRYYLVKWLSDWVREYGVDGFRCDTAKNVEVDSWVALKKECKDALKEWRQNNQGKPGAEWKDDFWMTGEVYPHGVYKDDYFTSGAFNSIINFDFQGQAFASPSSIDGTYREYAGKVNNDDSFNVLSYISTHDKNGMSRGGNMITAGNNLLLSPGGIEIYYGDETNRPVVAGTGDEQYRGNMNWDSINYDELHHWQKVGKFRSNHIAVGAGSHNKLSDSPYTFSRIYEKNGINDRVVISEPGKSGSCTVPVGDVFTEGQKVVDAYTGHEYTVTNKSVQVQAGDNGVVLLEISGPVNPTVGISPDSKEYWGDSVTAALSCSDGVTGRYSVDGVDQGTFTNGQQIEVGQDKEIGDTTTVTVTGTDADGKEVKAKQVTYTKVPIPKWLTIHAKDTIWDSAPNVYAYSGDGAAVVNYTGSWPGKAMAKEDDNGWYTITIESTITANVILNGSWGQYPAEQQPGIELTGEKNWYYNGKYYDHNPEDNDAKVTVKYINQENGQEISSADVITGEAGTTYTTTAKNIAGYTLAKTPSNAEGTFVKEGSTVTYEYTKSTDTLTIHAKNDSWTSAPNVYVYSGDGSSAVKYSGDWPGTRMTQDSDGWYTFSTDKSASGKVIFNDTWGQYPGEQQPGIDVSGDVWIYNNVIVPNPNKTGTVTVKYVDEANGNEVAEETVIKGNVGDNYKSEAKAITNYDLIVTPDNASGQYTEGNIVVTYKYKAIPKKLTITGFDAKAAGNSVKLAASVNVTDEITYSFWAFTPDGKWELIKDSTDNTADWTPFKAGNFVLWVYAKNAAGQLAYRTLDYTVNTAVARIQDDNSKMFYSGNWLTKYDSRFSNGTAKAAMADGAALTFSFKGTGINIISTLGPDRGVAKVTIDGQVYSADMFNENVQYAGTALEVSGLAANSIHTIKVEYTGLYSYSSTAAAIDVDAFDIVNGDIQ